MKVWKLGIIGWPLGYSLSPLMHEAALKAAGLEGEYKEYAIAPEQLEGWLQSEAPKLDGFNVTMPHKEAVYPWVSRNGRFGDSDAQQMGAINTVLMEQGAPIGYNTDGLGFLWPLRDPPVDMKGWRVVLLGAGGSAQAIALALEKIGIGRMWIWNRDPHFKRAKNLADKLNAHQGSEDFAIPTSNADSLPVKDCDLLVNATPLGMRGEEEEVPTAVLHQLQGRQLVYDIVYDPLETQLIKTAREKNCKVIEGWQMLAAQGAISFYRWAHIEQINGKAVWKIMREALSDHLARADRS